MFSCKLATGSQHILTYKEKKSKCSVYMLCVLVDIQHEIQVVSYDIWSAFETIMYFLSDLKSYFISTRRINFLGLE